LEDHLIILDIDVIIDFFSGAAPGVDVVSELIDQERAALTSISVFELYAGIEGKKRLRQIETLIQHLVVFPLNLVEAALAGAIYTDLKSRGQLIGTQDILIAGICLANHLPFYTKNVSHFSKIEGIRLISSHEILEE
jgi:predicted nucleic acid-binding protein